MMESYLREYDFEIVTKAPVFIGSGEKVGKKEYIYDRRANKVVFLDLKKMYQGLMKLRLLPVFQEYMLKERYDLYYFMKDHGIAPAQYLQWIDYTAAVGDPQMITRSTVEISRFVKDAYGSPYIPGSSMKGALRTILQTDYYLKNKEQAGKIAGRIIREVQKGRDARYDQVEKEMAQNTFHRQLFAETKISDVQNDILRGLIISDSEPLPKKVMCVCQKIDLGLDGQQKRLNLLRECIAPGTAVRFKITMDKSVCKYTAKEIVEAVKEFYRNYQQEFAVKYRGVPRINGTEAVFYLGGGAGYLSKTASYAVMHGSEGVKTVSKILDGNLSRQRDLQRQHDHIHDEKRGASPHTLKCTVYDGNLYQMGACSIRKMKIKPQ